MNPSPTPASEPPDESDDSAPDRWWTIPNLLCTLRFLMSGVLVGLAWIDQPRVYLVLLVIAWSTDLVDGRIARTFKQQSRIGPILDSIADGAMYLAMFAGVALMYPEVLRQEAIWLTAAFASYLLPLGTTFFRFGRWPSFHTRLAKTMWFVVGATVLVIFLDGPTWLIPIAAGFVIMTNVEAMAIALVLKKYRDDVISIGAALRRPGPTHT